jgi:hypothetical protein
LLTGSKDRLSLYDFSSYAWKRFSEIGELPPEAPMPLFPSIKLDLFYVCCTRALSDLAVVWFTENPGPAAQAAIAKGWFEPTEVRTLENLMA